MIPLGVDPEFFFFCQVMDPGSIPGERMFLLFFLFLLVQKQNKKNLFETSPQLPDPKSDALSIAPLRHFVEFAIKVQFVPIVFFSSSLGACCSF